MSDAVYSVVDVVDWLKAERDRHASLRDAAFRTDDWATGNPHDEQARNLYQAILEIEKSRKVIAVMRSVLQRRIAERAAR